MLPEQKLDALLTRHAEVEAALSGQHDPENFVKLSREFSDLGPIVETIHAYRAVRNELAELQAMLDDPATDPEMRDLAQSEKGPLARRLEELVQAVRLTLVPKD